jgi:hypothetical protein
VVVVVAIKIPFKVAQTIVAVVCVAANLTPPRR